MTQIILILIGIVISALLLMKKTREQVVGICSAALDATVRKNANKGKITAFLYQKREASNAELREHLGVTDRSVVRYMDELERKVFLKGWVNTTSLPAAGRGVVFLRSSLTPEPTYYNIERP